MSPSQVRGHQEQGMLTRLVHQHCQAPPPLRWELAHSPGYAESWRSPPPVGQHARGAWLRPSRPAYGHSFESLPSFWVTLRATLRASPWSVVVCLSVACGGDRRPALCTVSRAPDSPDTSRQAAFTAALARKAPSTSIASMVARAS